MKILTIAIICFIIVGVCIVVGSYLVINEKEAKEDCDFDAELWYNNGEGVSYERLIKNETLADELYKIGGCLENKRSKQE